MKSLKNEFKEKIALLRLKQGDSEAFGFIYTQYAEKIYAYTKFRVSNTDVAQDITHEVFLQAWESIVDGKQVDNLRAFIYRIAYHKVVDHYRSKSRQTELLDETTEKDTASENRQETDMELQLLKNKISTLKPDFQDVIILKHIEGLSISEIAKIISKEESATRVTLHRAMKALKDIYK